MQFQTESILNSLSTLKTAADIGLTAGSGFLVRNGMFYNVANIVGKKVTKTAYSAGALEKWQVKMPLVAAYAGKTFRFLVDVRLSGEVRSDYDRYDVYKGKPFYVEFATEEITTSAALADIVKQINKGLSKEGYKDLNVTFVDGVDANDGGSLVVEATFYGQRFDALLIQELKDTSTSSYSHDLDFITIATGTKLVSGAEAVGSAWVITKNLRLPSSSNTRFMALNGDEKPIDGANYNMYSFNYLVERDITGVGAVGQVMTSKTNHILYVKSDLVSAFETLLLTATGLTIV